MKAFRSEFPTVTLRLHMEALGGVTQLLLDRVATIGVSGPLPGNAGVAGIERIGIGDVALIPVASPDHPLARAGKNKPGAGRDHVQLVLTDRSPLTGTTDFAVVSPRTWRLADLGSKHMLLKEGIGWGNMPTPMVQEDINSGRLVHLDLPDIKGGIYSLEAIYRADTPPGPAAAWLIARFQSQVSNATITARPKPKSFKKTSEPKRKDGRAKPR
jgi:DNA-binding transcriptional LysR family regulator